jgi:glycosyltransferase involved in cell wall biosynthesis
MTSVVIAAHNEENVIRTCLDALADQTALDGPLEVVVSANACTDATVDIARACGVMVVDRPLLGKAASLNAGEAVAHGFPRIYLDADIVLPSNAIAELTAVLCGTAGVLAAVPRRIVNTKGRPWLVRAYFSINERLPAFADGLFGRGVIALSSEGRARFDVFPEMVADDLFLDSLFSAEEKATVLAVEVVVEAPITSADLMRRLVRVRRGNSQMREAARSGEVEVSVRTSDRRAWLRVVVREPRLLVSAVPYLAITLIAARRARRSASSTDWGRDESTRARPATSGEENG